MSCKTIILFVCLCLCAQLPCHAFLDRDMHLLTMKDGLLDNTVYSVCKDRQGLVWLGTRDGLNRFDGKRVRSFLFNAEGGWISDLQEAFDGILSFQSKDTLYAFDLRSERFLPVLTEDGHKINAVATQSGQGQELWVLTPSELWLTERALSSSADTLVLHVVKRHSRWKGLEGELTRLALRRDGGSVCVTDEHGRMAVADVRHPDRYVLVDLGLGSSLRVNHLLYDDDGYIWVSTLSYGIVRYDTNTGRILRLTYVDERMPGRLSHTDVFGVVPLEPGKYLAITWNGYTLLTLDKNNPGQVVTSVFNNTSSPIFRDIETRMISVYYDPNGVLWIGTDGGGGIWSDLRNQQYRHFYQDRHNEICSIVNDDEGYLWLATYHEGIMRSTSPFTAGEELDFVPVGPSAGSKRRTVLCSMKDGHGHLWFGNADGTLTRYSPRDKRFENIALRDGKGFLNQSSVWCLLADSKGRVWIGTAHGLLALDEATLVCRPVALADADGKPLRPFQIRALAETADGAIWLGTASLGIGRYDGEGNRLVTGYEKRAGMSEQSVRSLYASSDGSLYIGYMDAFAIFSPRADSIRHVYTTHDGLCNNFIGCMTEDDRGDMWLGSNSGISRFDKRQQLFYNYYVSGSNRSAFFWQDFLFWGNNKNLTYFNSGKLKQMEKQQKVLITDLEVNNRPVAIRQEINGQTILPNSISYMSGICLNHANRNFSLTFSNLVYSDEQQMYAYRLYPYQQEWIYTRGEEKISYANLEKGDYVFEVKNLPSDNIAVHAAEVTTLHVRILPHWTDTLLFRFLMVLAAGMLAYAVWKRIQLKNKRLEHEMQLEHEVFAANVERDNEKKLRMERERFFTEITHEVRTPLTLIMAPLHELLHVAGLPAAAAHKARLAYENSRLLHVLMDQLLYLRKIEVNMLRLKVEETDVNRLVEDASRPFQSVVEAGHYRFRVEELPEPVTLWVDVEKLVTALRNLLSNAFKYTRPQGLVRLAVSTTVVDGYPVCCFEVSDNGRGIPQEVKDCLFEPYRTGAQSPAYSTQSGIGMRIVKNIVDLHHGYIRVDDAEGGGTAIRMYIPEGKAHFAYEAAEEEVILADEQAVPKPAPPSVVEGERKRLLVIDDNPDVRRYVCSLLAADYVTDEAGNGEEALRRVEESVPDLIVCDIMMPVMDGLECCRRLKGDPRTASVPVLMLTAKAEDADAIRALGIGADDYMMKPFNPEMLKMRVTSLMRQRERLERLYAGTLMLKHEEEPAGEPEDYFLRQVMQVIEANLADEQFNVKMLADALHMSQPTLYRKIKQRSQLNAIDMIRSVRMSKAASLILEHRYSLQEVAEMVGYSDIRTLRKHFMAQFGVPPSKYSGEEGN